MQPNIQQNTIPKLKGAILNAAEMTCRKVSKPGCATVRNQVTALFSLPMRLGQHVSDVISPRGMVKSPATSPASISDECLDPSDMLSGLVVEFLTTSLGYFTSDSISDGSKHSSDMLAGFVAGL